MRLKRLSLVFALTAVFMAKGFTDSSEVVLPEPQKKGGVSVEEALDTRQSIRDYAGAGLTMKEASQMLWSAYGTNIWGKLTSPSAGAIYPLTIYAVVGDVEGVSAGVYKYDNKKHALMRLPVKDKRKELSSAALGQPWVANAPMLIVICADYGRMAARYGDKAVRYVDMEAGHCGQNIYLQAAALKLGTVAVGAFSGEEVRKILGVDEEPVYIFPVGRMR